MQENEFVIVNMTFFEEECGEAAVDWFGTRIGPFVIRQTIVAIKNAGNRHLNFLLLRLL
jgi:hypothetical protein